VQVRSTGTSGTITDNSDVFRLDNLASEVGGGHECGSLSPLHGASSGCGP
jgi:hypothetical protein